MASRDCPVIIERPAALVVVGPSGVPAGPVVFYGPGPGGGPGAKSGQGDGCKLAGCLRTGGDDERDDSNQPGDAGHNRGRHPPEGRPEQEQAERHEVPGGPHRTSPRL
jgi:hypothetical protein